MATRLTPPKLNPAQQIVVDAYAAGRTDFEKLNAEVLALREPRSDYEVDEDSPHQTAVNRADAAPAVDVWSSVLAIGGIRVPKEYAWSVCYPDSDRYDDTPADPAEEDQPDEATPDGE